jgi:transposase InsO family protein
MMAVWRRKPDGEVIVHSDQGSQYGSDDWQRFCRAITCPEHEMAWQLLIMRWPNRSSVR